MKRYFSIILSILTNNKKACLEIKKFKNIYSALSAITLRWILTWTGIFLAFLLKREPFIDPFININKNNYYFFELFFLIPFGLVLWIIETGTAKVLVILFKGGSTYKDILIYYSFTALLLWPFYGIVDTISIILNV